ncbi:MAG TPA: hypothetical protein VF209_03860 [Patescibacteria group bacterium]
MPPFETSASHTSATNTKPSDKFFQRRVSSVGTGNDNPFAGLGWDDEPAPATKPEIKPLPKTEQAAPPATVTEKENNAEYQIYFTDPTGVTTDTFNYSPLSNKYTSVSLNPFPVNEIKAYVKKHSPTAPEAEVMRFNFRAFQGETSVAYQAEINTTDKNKKAVYITVLANYTPEQASALPLIDTIIG